jgi:hypothetical protein
MPSILREFLISVRLPAQGMRFSGPQKKRNLSLPPSGFRRIFTKTYCNFECTDICSALLTIGEDVHRHKTTVNALSNV